MEYDKEIEGILDLYLDMQITQAECIWRINQVGYSTYDSHRVVRKKYVNNKRLRKYIFELI